MLFLHLRYEGKVNFRVMVPSSKGDRQEVHVNSITTNRTHITQHAQVRMQQRGIPRRLLELLFAYGDTVHAGDGCENITLSRYALRLLIADGNNPDDVARAARLAAVLGESGVVTVLRPTRGRRGRCYRRQGRTRRTLIPKMWGR